MEINDALARKMQLIKQIQVLEWDLNRKQINSGHKKRLDDMKSELTELEDKMSSSVIDDKLKEVK
ncbi:MAG: hypothetical protein KAQ83_02830 [Nanoarchaeota archaeon]|nr:hypothetical protein [Nanoarchaeota archaeon]